MEELFKIYKVDNKEALRIQNEKNDPHNHNFEELVIGIAGSIEHFIDFDAETYDAPFVSFVSKGKIHRVVPLLKDGLCDFWVLRFKSEFIPETTFNLYAYYHKSATLAFESGRCFNRINQICEMIDEEMKQEKPELSIVRELLQSLFSMIEAERKKQHADNNLLYRNQDTTFKNFLSILEENFRRAEGVNYYAEKLFMSSRNLNAITQSILQQSVSEIIETRKLIEAKNLLLTTDKSISEIGFEIGYTDKAYFASVFKKKSGQTASEFRDEMRKLIS
ncbi:helix-turn-helix domain-containing protein [Sphingobacterium sp. DK4209]|uniref:Helix-turn-helix domain-containing protein n=1 Tax=Sphingobacterium zhuxiongii TaxID=2662364 RepID=A0A5Q0QBB4_9SPHI|nr:MULTISPECIES: AraC family transcriptional regulator [unclassified Sphingobacterium]MVZ67086.1 helix-turn-helix domain-containing protein [Sphingobacterium sp. DK4209]QGA26843.1 helix-turn-helix domain-containing protein [Sphingobacterium sp. dk4302]